MHIYSLLNVILSVFVKLAVVREQFYFDLKPMF